MKILEINTFNKVVGGVERYVADMAATMEARGHRLVPLYLMPHEDHPGLVPSHRGYYMPELTPHHFGQIRDTFRALEGRQIRRRFGEILDLEQPDVVHCNNIYSPVLIRHFFGKVPIVRTVHDYRFMCPNLLKLTERKKELCEKPMGLVCYREGCLSPLDQNGLRHMLLLRWEREVSKDFDKLITKSAHMKRQLMQSGVPGHKVEVVPLSITLPEVSRYDGHLRDPDVAPVILFVGRVAEEKGLGVMLRALARLGSPFEAVIAGEGPVENEMRDLADELGLDDRVHFVGWKGGADLEQLYHDCHVVVVPSIWPEPFGLVGLEAMSNAKPVIAFEVGGIPEWLDHEHSGLLVPVGDEAGLAAAMEKLLEHPELALQLGINGRAEVEARFTMDVAAGKLLHIFEHLRKI